VNSTMMRSFQTPVVGSFSVPERARMTELQRCGR
jgi:hypothetical protein